MRWKLTLARVIDWLGFWQSSFSVETIAFSAQINNLIFVYFEESLRGLNDTLYTCVYSYTIQ